MIQLDIRGDLTGNPVAHALFCSVWATIALVDRLLLKRKRSISQRPLDCLAGLTRILPRATSIYSPYLPEDIGNWNRLDLSWSGRGYELCHLAGYQARRVFHPYRPDASGTILSLSDW
jgi:hypothetical protein